MTEVGRSKLMDKYGVTEQKVLEGKTEAYHFQCYKSYLFNKVQRENLDLLLKSRGIKGGIKFIENLPTASTTKLETAKDVFECFAEAKGISQPECLLEFLLFCEDKDFPLIAFEKDVEGLKITIEGLKKYVADGKHKAVSEKNSIERNKNSINNSLLNIPLRELKLGFELHDKFDILSPDERYLLSFSTEPGGITLKETNERLALKPEQLKNIFDRLIKEQLVVVEDRQGEECWKISAAGRLFLKHNPGALFI